MDKELKAAAIMRLFAAFSREGEMTRMKIYADELADIPADVLDVTCRRLMRQSKFLPSIAEIIEAAHEVGGSEYASWPEALTEIEKAMQSTPWGHTPQFSRPEIAEAVNAYGWNDLQMTLSANITTVKAQLRNIYEQVCQRRRGKHEGEKVLALMGKRLNQLEGRTL